MAIYNASDYGIQVGEEIGKSLYELLKLLSTVDGEKTLVFDKGEYYLDSDTCHKRLLYITNTVGDNEWREGEIPHLNNVAINFEGVSDLTLQGNGCVFVIRGQMTNIAISDSKNIVLQNFSIRTENPDVHELEVVRKGIFSIDFKLDCESQYILQSGKYYFVGKDYKVPFLESSIKAFWIGKLNKSAPDSLKRVNHPLLGTYKIVEIAPHTFRAYYALPNNHRIGDSYYLFEVSRKHVGIFVERSENVKLSRILQHFNYSLGLVCQDCINVDVEHCYFAPHKNSSKLMASMADFIQICMCRGDVNITDNCFVGSGDDCLNAHGVHYKITRVAGREITVRYSHRQTHGFNPLRVGDTIRFVNPNTLIGDNQAVIENSTLINEFEIKLILSDTQHARVGDVIEDISAVNNLTFSNNIMSRIITRGVLATIGGKVLIENNCFMDTHMSSILISDDAKLWYESGSVNDVTISGNTFMECPAYNVMIKPENGKNKDFVHKNIIIKDNVMSTKKGGVNIKCASGVVLKNNKHLSRIKIKNSQVENIRSYYEQY